MKIVTYPDPVLRQKAKPMARIDGETRRKVEEMMELMYQADGVGLAAPQVGWSVRLFIIDTDGNRTGEKVFINPTILETDGEQNKEEGCLSFPGILGKVIRAQRIRGQAYNLEGQKLEIEADGLFSRAWQHELDHLNGCLFIDKMSPASRLSVSQPLKELERSYTGKTKLPV